MPRRSGLDRYRYLYHVVRIGRIQELGILRITSQGVILGDDDELEVPLPKNEAPKNADVDGTLNVFVHHDAGGSPVASMKFPKAQVGEFAPMKVQFVDHRGAHMDWGVEPELVVPHRDQEREMFEGNWYIVRVVLDPSTGRLHGSSKVSEYLDNDKLSVAEGERVDLLIHAKSDLGFSAIVNNRHHGLLHANEVYKPVSVNDRIEGYVKRIREDNKLDITLQPIGFRQYNDANVALLEKRLRSNNGFLPFTDHSSPDEIHSEFGISKKAFKKALGTLYKLRKVKIQNDGIELIGKR